MAALQRLEEWGDPRDRLAAAARPSLEVARRSGDSRSTSLGRTLVPSDPHGVSTPSGLSRDRAYRADFRRTAAPPALSLLYRGPSQHPHTVPRTRRPPSDDASSPGLSCPTTHAGAADPFSRSVQLRGVPRPGFRPPSRRPPPSLPRLAARSVHGLHPPRRSPRGDQDSLRSPLPSWRSPRRFASPPWGACGRGRLQGLDPDSSSFCPSGSRRTRRVDAFLGFIPPELVSRACRGRFVFAARSPRTRWVGSDVPSHLRLRVLQRARPGRPSRGDRLSWGSSPSTVAEPRESRSGGRAHDFTSRTAHVARGARPLLAPSTSDPTGAFAPARPRRPRRTTATSSDQIGRAHV